MGIVTVIGSGLIRDVLVGRPTLLMRPELYAVPVCLGCIAITAALKNQLACRQLGTVICILVILTLRAAAIHWHLKMPVLTGTGGEGAQ